MDSILRTFFRAAIESRKESAFQDVVDSIYSKRFNSQFTSVKQKRDKGCDGIVENKTILAAYAPERLNLKDFKQKVDDDFKKYQDNWSATYPSWEYILNGEYTAQMIQHLDSKKNGCGKTDVNRLLDIVAELPHFKRRELAGELGINEQYIVNDVLKAVIEDLFKLSEQCEGTSDPHQSPPYIEDKIRLNYDVSDVEEALKEYQTVVEHFAELKDILRFYQDFEVGSLKVKILNCYGKLAGNFKQRFEALAEQFSERNKSDDYYVFFVRVVLMYFFETCVIGQRPETEK